MESLELHGNPAIDDTPEATKPAADGESPTNSDWDSENAVVKTNNAGYTSNMQPSSQRSPLRYYSIVRSKCSGFMRSLFEVGSHRSSWLSHMVDRLTGSLYRHDRRGIG